MKPLVEKIHSQVEYAAWCSDGIQNNFDKLNCIEKRSMNQHIELHETIRMIKNAVDVYKDSVAIWLCFWVS